MTAQEFGRQRATDAFRWFTETPEGKALKCKPAKLRRLISSRVRTMWREAGGDSAQADEVEAAAVACVADLTSGVGESVAAP